MSEDTRLFPCQYPAQPCSECGTKFSFDEGRDLYDGMHDSCAKKAYPLAYAVRRRIEEIAGIGAARAMFGEEHADRCIPDEMLGENPLEDIMKMFRAIGLEMVKQAGLDARRYEVIVEPSLSGHTTWSIVTCHPYEAGWVVDGESCVVFFQSTKAWSLGGCGSEEEVERMLQEYEVQLISGLERCRLRELLTSSAFWSPVISLLKPERGEVGRVGGE